ncbi:MULTISPECIES: hypothetical protein [Deferrisoma]
MTKAIRTMMVLAVGLCLVAGVAAAECNPADYEPVTQADLVRHRDEYQGKKVQVTGVFLFTGSDFCYQIRKTKINTRDYFCFALGTPSLVRLYLKKDHPQADELLNLKKGAKVTAYGVFDYLGNDYNYMVVDGFEVKGAP